MADWAGYFGDEYTERWKEVPNRDVWWETLINKFGIQSVYELGCNNGGNLDAIRRVSSILGAGCDVNSSAVSQAKTKGHDVAVWRAEDLPPTYQRHDLVFTTGLLIHLQTPEVIKVMKRAREQSRKYVLLNEYASHYDEEIPYRDIPHSLYKRAYGQIYWALFPDDALLMHGDATKDQGFDNTHWWMFEKWS